MATIAPLVSKLTLNTSAFTAGLSKASSATKGFVSDIGNAGAKVFAFGGALAALAAGAGLTAMVKDAFTSIDETAKLSDRLGVATEDLIRLRHAANLKGIDNSEFDKSLEVMVRKIGQAAQDSPVSIQVTPDSKSFAQGMDAIAATAPKAEIGVGVTGIDRAAKKLGDLGHPITATVTVAPIDPADLGGVADAEDNITKGGPAASQALAKIGLSAQALANQTPDAAFRAIAEGIKGVQNPAERAAVAVAIFGRSGQTMLNTLMLGKEGLAAAGAEADKLGLTFSRIDAAKVELANESLTRLKGIAEGVAQTLAIQLSPFIAAAAEKIADMATSGEGMGNRVITAFEWVLQSVAKTMDWLELLRTGFYALRTGASVEILGLVKAIDLTGQAVVALLNLLPGVQVEWTDTFKEMANNLTAEIDQSITDTQASFARFQSGANSKAVSQFFDDIRAKATANAKAIADHAAASRGASTSMDQWGANMKKITETIGELQKRVEQFNMTEAQKKMADLTALGATPAQLSQAKGLLDQLDALEAAKKKAEDLANEGKSIFDATRSPMEKYEEQITKLGELLNAGAIDWDTYGRAVQNARKELEGADKTKPPAPAAFVVAGSAQAQKLAYDAQHGGADRGDVARKQLNAQERMAKSLTNIERRKPADDQKWDI